MTSDLLQLLHRSGKCNPSFMDRNALQIAVAEEIWKGVELEQLPLVATWERRMGAEKPQAWLYIDGVTREVLSLAAQQELAEGA